MTNANTNKRDGFGKLTAPAVFTVTVKMTGWGNFARVRGEGVTASSTSDERTAAQRAVLKLAARNGFGEVAVKFKQVTRSQRLVTYLATLTPVEQEVAA